MIPVEAWYAGIISGLLSLAELVNARGKWPCWGSAHFVIALILIDGGSGLGAFPLVVAVFGQADWFTGYFQVLLAGLCGPAIIRSQLALLGSGQEDRIYGPAVVIGSVRRFLKKRIESIERTKLLIWATSVAVPGLASISPTDLLKQLEDYIGGLKECDMQDARKTVSYMRRTVQDSTVPDADKKKALVIAVDRFGARKLVRSLLAP